MLINMEMDSKTLVVDAHVETINNNFCILIVDGKLNIIFAFPRRQRQLEYDLGVDLG